MFQCFQWTMKNRTNFSVIVAVTVSSFVLTSVLIFVFTTALRFDNPRNVKIFEVLLSVPPVIPSVHQVSNLLAQRVCSLPVRGFTTVN